MTPTLLSQRDPKWSNLQLGTGNLSIGQAGCTITAISMRYGVTPEFLNQRMKEVEGYQDGNLVIWKKLEQALPGVIFKWKYDKYDNDIVKASMPTIVEVDGSPIGAPRHWVLFIGNQKMYDPWDGMEKPTNAYKPISFVVMEGEYKKEGEKEGCLVPNTPEWRKKYEDLVAKSTEHDKFIKAGFASFTDVVLKLEEKDREIKELKKRKGADITQDKVNSLVDELPGVIKASNLIELWGTRWLEALSEVKARKTDKKVTVEETPAETGTSWLMNLLGIAFNRKGGEGAKK